jgi:anaerobic magnesium-protoporphyrin IX monomethyl ester cyclase
MRVLFVYPNLYTQMGFNHGLAALSAVLKEAGHETELLNLNENLPPVPTEEEAWELVQAWSPGLIGFSCLTQQYGSALEIAQKLRERAAREGVTLPPLVVGGIHPTMVPEEVMRDGVWDHVGVGECEDSLLELVRRTEAGELADDVPNFLSWPGGQRPEEFSDSDWTRNPVGPFPNFPAQPLPDYALFDTQRITDLKDGWFSVMTSRGCPYRCTYCLNHRIVDTYKADLKAKVADLGFFRFRDPVDVVKELKHVLAHYDRVKTFLFDDDLFTQNAAHAIAVCAEMVREGIDVPFVVNSHVKRLDPRVAEALGKAGCSILKLGIESGSARVRKQVLKRHMTDLDIMETVASAEEHKLHTSGFLMVGLPTETNEERWETVDLLAETRIGRFRGSFFFPFPGTEGWDMTVAGGYINPDEIDSKRTFTDGSVLDFGPEENLFIDKLGRALPWFVNARMQRFHSDSPASKRYAPLMERVMAMDAEEWQAFMPQIQAVDAEYSAAARTAGELHYAIKYGATMGVRSDWFIAEEAGTEWYTAAAEASEADVELLGASAGAGA